VLRGNSKPCNHGTAMKKPFQRRNRGVTARVSNNIRTLGCRDYSRAAGNWSRLAVQGSGDVMPGRWV
jgi:hypothetical protein